ncbi:[Fe-Fe] hydrogenase large subunit C-terminal domain-containing protein [Phascolarctobacterium sp.]|uniref:[Fe-Fe] hydrogenase large subunit C-terminal domain-containing protein n=1 Tax=Phascolarctobacterium sp. TaxID=2049039 RepID=UPI0015A93C40|nr:[Fe-Fe] hydrogenase large subunit C-terminal domain-containing protein [uncultured Phascolarctobacterium sp.]
MAGGYFHSIRFLRSQCQGCVTCVKACPTEAIRVRNGKAELIESRCIDCGECLRRCGYHAIVAETDKLEEIEQFKYNIALPPPSLYAQFPTEISAAAIWEGLHRLGFDEIFDVAVASEYISLEISDYLANYSGVRRPLISSTCPAVLRLIQVKFPELIKQVVPVLPPTEAAAIYVKNEVMQRTGLTAEEIGVWFIAPCPSKNANIRQSVDVRHTQINGSLSISEVYGKLLKIMGGEVQPDQKVTSGSSYGLAWGSYGGELEAAGVENGLAVHGIDDVYDVLEQISLNKMRDVDYVECSACSGGCIGGPLTAENKFVAEKNLKLRLSAMRSTEPGDRLATMAQSMVCEGFPQSAAYVKKLIPRPMMQLDDDILEAMKKFEHMEEVLRSLPGLDCGACGAPSCQCLAEDIVQGKANEIDCIFKLRSSVKRLAHGMLELAKQIPIASEPDEDLLEEGEVDENTRSD